MHKSHTPYLLLLGIVTASLGLVVEPLLVSKVAAVTTDPDGNVFAKNLASMARLCSYASVAIFFFAGFIKPIPRTPRTYPWLPTLGVLLSLAAVSGYTYGMFTIDGGSKVKGTLYSVAAIVLAFVGGLFCGSSNAVENIPPANTKS